MENNDFQINSANPAPLPTHWPSGRYPRLAEAYVLIQQYKDAFPPMEALNEGTLFPELVRPYVKKK